MVPPLCFTMPYTVDKPRPVPLPDSFVVKNGSKIRATVAGSIPPPVSRNDSLTCGPGCAGRCSAANLASRSTSRVSMARVPPVAMASRALTAKFRMICSICTVSASTWPMSAPRTDSSSMSSPIRRRSIGSMAEITTFRSRTSCRMICLRLKANNCLVSEAARSPAERICCRSSRSGSSGASPAMAMSAVPPMTVRRLLKSWAMPPASRPTLSIFCACLSWDSNSTRSVMSTWDPINRIRTPCASRSADPRARMVR